MALAQWCIKNNRTFLVAMLCIVFSGISTYMTISRLEDPEFTIRDAMVVTYFPGATPYKMESLVTEELEKAIRTIPEVEHVLSESMNGISIIRVKVFERYTDMKPIWDRLRNEIDDVAPKLPSGVVGPYVNDQFGDVFGIVAALRGDGYSYRELKEYAERIQDRLLAMPDVGKVAIHGEQDEAIYVEFSDAKLAELGVNPKLILDVLKSQNAITPGGNALVGPERIVIEATGEFNSMEDIARTTFVIPGTARNVSLADIATIRRGYEDPAATMTRFNGENCLMIAVNMAKGGNIVELGDKVAAQFKEIQADLPVGLDLDFVAYQPKFVQSAINEFMVNLLEAFAFVVIVMLLYAGLRTAVVAAMLVPMAVLMSIALMPFFNVVLQRVSIASLIIALGMLVDNGVVVSEAILVRLAAGQERMKAVVESVKGLRIPLLAASLTTIFAFLPIATAQSMVGEYCLSMFIVITLTLLSSWVLSLTFVPFCCYYFLKPKLQRQTFENVFYRLYRGFLLLGLKQRTLSVGVAVALMAVASWGFTKLPQTFFPPNERDMFIIDFWQPYGTDIGTTSQRVADLENWLLAQDETASVGSIVGSGGPRWYLALSPEQDNPNYAFMIVNTKTIEGAATLLDRTREEIAAHFPDTRADVKMLENGPPVGAPIQVRLSGPSMKTLYSLRDRVNTILESTPGVYDIWDDWGEWTKKLQVDVQQENAKRVGISTQDIGFSLNAIVNGTTPTKYREGTEDIPIVLRLKESERVGLGRIEDASVYNVNSYSRVPLSQVATVRLVWQPSDIRRRDHQRTMTVKATLSGRFASDALADIQPRIDALTQSPDWPRGYKVEYGGEQEETAKAQRSIYVGLPLAMLLIVLTLVSQFNSIRRTLIILLAIPPMIIGVTFGLHVSDAPFGFMAMLGMISLMGIIINNAIIFIDQVDIENKRGHTPQDAIVVAAQRRLRPILMTASTTVIGLIPLSLQGGEMWRPMANTLIFGLSFATFLTLGLAPVLYSIFFKAGFKGYEYDPEILNDGD
ncbi:efflux RND transporter permease subunit [Paucidesulfovibrio longus]|uniref:efflux RND transporter permease subunit n=1 Tax=Paucidesulfovibrio longus TaxID=889 RepID=UPI0003B36E00|nr:efflux RND transporter permease subunit [Paucidesulfovibrio longus]